MQEPRDALGGIAQFLLQELNVLELGTGRAQQVERKLKRNTLIRCVAVAHGNGRRKRLVVKKVERVAVRLERCADRVVVDNWRPALVCVHLVVLRLTSLPCSIR